MRNGGTNWLWVMTDIVTLPAFLQYIRLVRFLSNCSDNCWRVRTADLTQVSSFRFDRESLERQIKIRTSWHKDSHRVYRLISALSVFVRSTADGVYCVVLVKRNLVQANGSWKKTGLDSAINRFQMVRTDKLMRAYKHQWTYSNVKTTTGIISNTIKDILTYY